MTPGDIIDVTQNVLTNSQGAKAPFFDPQKGGNLNKQQSWKCMTLIFGGMDYEDTKSSLPPLPK